jgi:hypothetical protein
MPKTFRNLLIGIVITVPVAVFVFWDRYEPPTEPTDPTAIEAKRFAHSIKLPDSIPTAKYYPWWLGSEAYFKFLCEREAGEFILKTIEKVRSVYQIRPRSSATDAELQDRFSLEDPYGYTLDETTNIPVHFVAFPNTNYVFFETILSPEKSNVDPRHLIKRVSSDIEIEQTGLPSLVPKNNTYWRYFYENISSKEGRPIIAESTHILRSRFGYVWRGIQRPHDREKGIAGGELIILDLATKEVLGVRRGFVWSHAVNIPSGIQWLYGKACPQPNPKKPARPYAFDYIFISKVLHPYLANPKDIGVVYGQ